MSSNYTDMPIADGEFIRAYIVVMGDKIIDTRVYPVMPFRVDTDAFQALLEKCIKRAEKNVEEDKPTNRASQQCNYEINQGLAQLEAEGRLIRPPKMLGLMTGQYLAALGPGNFVETCDGYSIFNPYQMPPCQNNYVN